MKKRILAVLLSVSCMAAMMTGCGSKADEPKEEPSKEEETAGEEETGGKVDDILADVEAQMNEALGELPETGQGEKIGILISSTDPL